MNLERVGQLIRDLLIEIGEDPDREGLRDTPARVAKAYGFLTSGYRMDKRADVTVATFESEANNMIILRDIEVYSLCEHHILPFFGRCHIGYIARERMLGFSELARIVDRCARRLQIQEHLTAQIARKTMDTTEAEGVGVVMECRHLCTMMRGIEKQSPVMTTSSVLGSFHNDPATRAEFLNLIAREVS